MSDESGMHKAKMYYIENVNIYLEHYSIDGVIEIKVRKGVMFTDAIIYDNDYNEIDRTVIVDEAIRITDGIIVVIPEDSDYIVVGCSLNEEYNYIMHVDKKHLRCFI